MVRKQSYKTYRTQKGCRKVNQAAFNRTDGKTDVNGASPQEPRLCRRRRASALCGNPSARGAPLALAGHRPCRKLRYNTFPLQQDWRGAPCGNMPTLENNIVAFASGGLRARSLPPELAAPLEANPRRFGVSWSLGAGRFTPYVCVVPRQAFPRPAAIAGEYGASGHFPSELTLRQYVGNRQSRCGEILSELAKQKSLPIAGGLESRFLFFQDGHIFRRGYIVRICAVGILSPRHLNIAHRSGVCNVGGFFKEIRLV